MALIQKSFSDIITFSRSSNATRVGPTGVLEYAPHNLFLQSQTFDNASWLKSNSSITANAIAAPDGTVTADKLVEAATTSVHSATQAFTFAADFIYTTSVYAKAGERSFLIIQPTGDTRFAYYNLSNGTVGTVSGSPLSTQIQSVGNNWYRCTITVTSPGAAAANCILYSAATDGNATYTGDGTSGIYVWGAQLAVGPYALDYVPTTSAAVYGPRFDYDGSGVTIVEPVSTNLFTYSEDVANWSGYLASTTVTSNAAASPTGTVTADKVEVNGSSGFIYQRYLSPVAGSYCYSIWVKADANTTAFFRIVDAGIPTSATLSVAVTTTWQRITLPIILPSSSSQIDAGIDQRAAVGGPGTSATVYLWGAQLEVGSTATAYMVSGASNGFRAVPVVSGSATPKGLLVEEQRQNIYTYSEDFSNAAWSKTGTTVIANSTGAPDGLVTADEITFGTGTSALVQTKSGLSAGARYEPSVYIKRITTSGEIILRNTEDGSYGRWAVNLALLGSGWERITRSHAAVTITAEFVASPSGICAPAFYGSDSNIKAHLWGAQLEAGSFATSYIPTLASAVTRSADVASVNTLSPWFNATEGTVYFEAQSAQGTNAYPYSLFGATTQNRIFANYSSSARMDSGIRVAGVFEVSVTTSNNSAPLNTFGKGATAYKVNDFGFSWNGAAALTDTSTSLPSVLQLDIGNNGGLATNFLNGTIKKIAYYPRRLTNAELQALTS